MYGWDEVAGGRRWSRCWQRRRRLAAPVGWAGFGGLSPGNCCMPPHGLSMAAAPARSAGGRRAGRPTGSPCGGSCLQRACMRLPAPWRPTNRRATGGPLQQGRWGEERDSSHAEQGAKHGPELFALTTAGLGRPAFKRVSSQSLITPFLMTAQACSAAQRVPSARPLGRQCAAVPVRALHPHACQGGYEELWGATWFRSVVARKSHTTSLAIPLAQEAGAPGRGCPRSRARCSSLPEA